MSNYRFCTQLYNQNKTLLLWANSQANNKDENYLNICVKDFLSGLKEYIEEFREMLSSFDQSDIDNNRSLRSIKNGIESKLKMCSNPRLLSTHFTEKQHNDFSSLKFKLYLALVTLIDPNWIRISMLPSIAPAGHLHHPGGLVICETNKHQIINLSLLQEIRKISSIPFLPWMLTARTTERGDDQHLAPKLFDFEKGISNDYRNIEYLMVKKIP
ncbi:MAG: hypothetical protein IPK25_19335 [Saprospiraceae bacterium]|nr:hypothetical protein [Saprospiraceae bacterium]